MEAFNQRISDYSSVRTVLGFRKPLTPFRKAKSPGAPVILINGALYAVLMPENYLQLNRLFAEKLDIKHLQRHPWNSKDRYRAYGQRNQVETSNQPREGLQALQERAGISRLSAG